MLYHFKLTNMLTGEKNRSLNCLTTSNLKLDDVFSNIWGKSACSITNYILDHLGETFDVSPFVDRRCKTPIEDIQATIDEAVSSEQAIKPLNVSHFDELEAHKREIEQETQTITEPFSTILDFLYTLPWLNKNPMTTINILSEIDSDMSVFPSSKHLVS